MTDPQRDGLDFSTIHAQERAAIREPDGSSGNAEKPWTGLAFSGGGIRSATFNLGILQALAEMKLLRQFDYLSCVSGGGYIGGWLSAFIHRCGGKVEDTEEQLKTGGEEIPAIRFLRSYSNYLTPKAGLFSADALTAIATYLRNLYLNLTLLLLYLGALLLLPRLLVWLARWLTGWEGAHAQVDPRLLPLFGGGIACIGVAMLFIGLNLGNRDGFETRPPFYTRQGWVLALVAVPALLSAWLIGYGFYAGAHQLRDITLCGWVLWGMAVYVPPWFAGWGLGRLLGRGRSAEEQFGLGKLLLMGLFAVLAGALGGALAAGLAKLSVIVKGFQYSGAWIASALSTALLLKFYSLTVIGHIGLMGRYFSHDTREWWSRLGGWLLMFALVWATVFGIVFIAPAFFLWAPNWFVGSGAAAWVASTAAGVLLGNSPTALGKNGEKLRLQVAKLTPYIFVLGLFGLLSLGLHELILHLSCGECVGHTHPADTSFGQIAAQQADYFKRTPISLLAALFAGSLVLATALAWRFDVNLFSIYHFYRQRLVRCYLGASRSKTRIPHPFTGFDPRDDLKLADFCREEDGRIVCQRPYPIHNTAMNLVAGKELAWQQRRAAAFAFTPLYCGYSFTLPDEKGRSISHYRSTAAYMGGFCTGSAMAISGAAVSPNMGYQSSPALTFLLTVFNVRLGHWSGNPGHPSAWAVHSPPFSGTYLLKELFGLTDYTSSFVYLSDGGHFENLGIYELVRRRCNCIVAIDAGQDEKSTFDDLGNAIRKCYADFGVVIDVHCDELKTGYSAVGRVIYPDAAEGTLIYLKPRLTGAEPADLQNYQLTHPDFPNQSTKDQWFDESQFESYRKLGHWIGKSVFAAPLLEASQRKEVAGSNAPELLWIRTILREQHNLPP
ncbi:MAG: hypothetical protein WCA45_08130 [Thiobacillaceae bacterium]